MKRFKEWFSKHKNEVFEHFGLLLCFLVLGRAKILQLINPFLVAMAFAMLLLNKNGLLIALEFFVSSSINNLTLEGLIISVSVFFCIVLLYISCKILKKKINLVSCLIFAIISQSAFLYFNIGTTEKLILSLANMAATLCFVYVFYVGFGAVFSRGIQSRFRADETVCFSVFCIAFFCGIANIFIVHVNISIAIVTLLILFVSRSFSKTITLSLASLAGLGFAFYCSSLVYMAVFVSFAIAAALLQDSKRIFVSISVILIDLLFGFFFNVYAVYDFYCLSPLVVAVLVFLFIPNKLFQKFKNFSFSYEGNLISEFMIFEEREKVKNRLMLVQNLFLEMQNEYRNLSLGSAERKGACEMLADDLICKVCSCCEKRIFCRENQKMRESLEKLFEFGMEKQKVTILDATNLFAEKCACLSSVIFEVNSSLKNYFEYEKTVKENNKGKIMMSEQMGSTAGIFKELAKTSFSDLKIDKTKAKEVLDVFAENGVVANECVVLKDDFGVKKVVAVIRNKDILLPGILKGLKKVFRIDFSVEKRKMSKYSGWTIAEFVPSEKYKLAIGFASSAKENSSVSGDTSAILKIDGNRYLFAISDGMGHGEKANKIATSALGLVENFYKVGFSSETIVSSINKILLPREEESFVALDACIVDLSVGVADFVKVGASVSVVKSQNQCKMIYSDSLPLGVTSLPALNVQSTVLKEQDIVVLASDGIVDSFDKVEDFVCYVNNSNISNIQLLADDIMEEAQSRTKHEDDMTVIVLKISANNYSAWF